jgi:hypothetical protein
MRKMAYKYEGSAECSKTGVDLFSVPPTSTVVKNGKYIEIPPTNSVTENAVMEFPFESNGMEYLDLANTYLNLSIKIMKKDGTPIADTEPLSLVNYFIHTMFRDVEVSLNNKPISTQTGTYPYRAYIENLMSYATPVKQTQLTYEVFYKDDTGKMDNVNPKVKGAANWNTGVVWRCAYMDRSRTINMVTRIHLDIFFQHRYMLSQVPVKISLKHSDSNFCLIGTVTTTDYKVHIVKAALHICKVMISPAVYNAHAESLE